MFDLLLINGCVITVDSAHTVYQPGYVAVEKDTIAAIGPMSDLPVLPEAGRVIDLCGHAVLPGLVDAHGHAGHCLIKNLFEYRDDWDDLAEQVYYQCTDTEFWRAEGSLAAAERIKFGITTGVSMVGSTPRIDIIEPVGANLEGSSRVGIRQLSGIGCANGPWPKKARAWNGKEYTESTVTPKMAYRSTEEALKAYNGRHPLETCIVAPGRMGLRPGESAEDNIAHNREMYRLAEEYGVPLHTHAFAGDIQFLYDTTPEVLKVGLSLTHSTGLSQEEIAILAKTGAYVFHGPATHSNILKTCPVYELLQAGAHVAVVTDGTAPDRSYDIWRDMKMLQVLAAGPVPRPVPAALRQGAGAVYHRAGQGPQAGSFDRLPRSGKEGGHHRSRCGTAPSGPLWGYAGTAAGVPRHGPGCGFDYCRRRRGHGGPQAHQGG